MGRFCRLGPYTAKERPLNSLKTLTFSAFFQRKASRRVFVDEKSVTRNPRQMPTLWAFVAGPAPEERRPFLLLLFQPPPFLPENGSKAPKSAFSCFGGQGWLHPSRSPTQGFSGAKRGETQLPCLTGAGCRVPPREILLCSSQQCPPTSGAAVPGTAPLLRGWDGWCRGDCHSFFFRPA